jgi:UDP-N-acetyl-2-amino-2-deoxyglucuronate dehydrogenase
MRFAVLGCGVIGRVHATTITGLAPRAELVVVVDAQPERAASFAHEFGAEPATSLAAVLARSDVDAVAICTPSASHAKAAIAVLEAGKDVIVEKPLDISLPAALGVVAAQQRTGRTAMVISQHRHDDASVAVYHAIRTGQLGVLTSGVASVPWWRSDAYYDSGEWRGTVALDGGGALMNQAIHTLDLLVWFLGEPVEVFGWTGRLTHPTIEVEDTAVATIRFAAGALGVMHAATSAYPGLAARVQVHGNLGSAVVEGDRLRYYRTSHAGEPVGDYGTVDVVGETVPATPTAGDSAAADVGNRLAATSHTAQYEDFLDAVRDARPPLVTVAAAARTLAVVDAIYKSSATGSPVTIEGFLSEQQG